MGMKYKDPTTGNFKEINVKVADTLPVGSEVDYNGTTIPTGWEEVDSPNDYSTDEVRIGTWIDGKPLYRKVYTGTKVSGSNKGISLSDLNIDYVNFYGFIIGNQGTTEGAYEFPINYYENPNAFIRTNLYRKVMGLAIISAESPYFNGDYTIVVEYTKTTD